jgi:hypothetical protein
MKVNFIVTICLLVSSGCYNDKFNELHPLDGYVDTCDTSPDTYSVVVKNIMALNCSSCHNQNTKSGGITLNSFSDVKAIASGGKLMGSVQHQSGYQPMPPESSLRDCDIQQLKNWIAGGMPE